MNHTWYLISSERKNVKCYIQWQHVVQALNAIAFGDLCFWISRVSERPFSSCSQLPLRTVLGGCCFSSQFWVRQLSLRKKCPETIFTPHVNPGTTISKLFHDLRSKGSQEEWFILWLDGEMPLSSLCSLGSQNLRRKPWSSFAVNYLSQLGEGGQSTPVPAGIRMYDGRLWVWEGTYYHHSLTLQSCDGD